MASMGEFARVAEDILLACQEADDGISAKEIGDIIDRLISSPVNCYPGEPGVGCFKIGGCPTCTI